jgi:hypothetical protein
MVVSFRSSKKQRFNNADNAYLKSYVVLEVATNGCPHISPKEGKIFPASRKGGAPLFSLWN